MRHQFTNMSEFVVYDRKGNVNFTKSITEASLFARASTLETGEPTYVHSIYTHRTYGYNIDFDNKLNYFEL